MSNREAIPGTGRPSFIGRLPAEIRDAIAQARRAGWTLETTGGGHLRLRPPGEGQSIIFACTPSDVRASRNFLAKLRRTMKTIA
jgi:hypothetical protein